VGIELLYLGAHRDPIRDPEKGISPINNGTYPLFRVLSRIDPSGNSAEAFGDEGKGKEPEPEPDPDKGHRKKKGPKGGPKHQKHTKSHPSRGQEHKAKTRLKGQGKWHKRAGKTVCPSGKAVGGVFLLGCEATCASEYDNCLDDANAALEDALEATQGFAPPLNQQQADLAMRIFYLDAAECATVYVACGLGCLVPFSFF